MSTARVLVYVALCSLLAATIVAVVSRTPAELRDAQRPPDALDPQLGASFRPVDVERHDAFRRIGYTALAASIVLQLVVLLLLARGPIARLAERAAAWRGGWFTAAVVVAIVVGLWLWLSALPLAYVRGHVVGHAWNLSTQDATGWLTDQLRGLAIGSVMSAIAALAFFGVVRWQPKSWWLIGWVTFTLLTALLTFLWPVAIAPLFNRFTSLEAGPLRQRVVSLASEAGVELDDVLVADASKRSTLENAYVAGLGATKRMVLYDTLIEAGDEDQTAFVVAHELGHEVESHVPKGLGLSAVGLLAGFLGLYLLSRVDSLWRWAGAEGVGDVAALPLLILYAVVAGFLLLPAQNAASRAFERRADQIAFDLTDDSDTAIRSFRRLAYANLADLDPSPAAVWLLYTHPPIQERIEAALAHARAAP